MTRSPPKEVLLRGLSLIEALNRRQVSRLETLAEATGLAKPTANRLLAALAAAGYVRRLPRRRGYSLDAGILNLASGYRLEDAAVTAAGPVMAAFTARHKWPLAVGTRDGRGMRVREATLGQSPMASNGDESLVGRRIDFFISALGRAYIAFCPREERDEVLDAMRRDSPADRAALVAMLRRIAADGYALSAPRVGDPAVGLAVPIRVEGRVAACLSMRYLGRAIAHDIVVRRYLGLLRRAAGEIAAAADELWQGRLSRASAVPRAVRPAG